MSVRHILAQKGRQIEAIGPDTQLAQAILHLASKRIGALLVVDADQRIVGILSERDIIRALVAGSHALEDHVRDHMTEFVVTCSLDTSLAEVMDMMTRGRFRHVPVMADNEVVGIVSIGDVVKHRLAEMESENSAIIAYIAAG
jgi:CBS domain-containing protein